MYTELVALHIIISRPDNCRAGCKMQVAVVLHSNLGKSERSEYWSSPALHCSLRMAWRGCCCCRVSSLCWVLAVTFNLTAIMGFLFYFDGQISSWDVSKIEESVRLWYLLGSNKMVPSVALLFNLFGMTACICSLLASLCDQEKLLLPLLVWILLDLWYIIASFSSKLSSDDILLLLLYYGLWWFIVYSHREHLRQEQQSRDENTVSVGPDPLNQNRIEISMIYC